MPSPQIGLTLGSDTVRLLSSARSRGFFVGVHRYLSSIGAVTPIA